MLYLDRKWKVEIHFCIQYSVHTCKYWICEVLKRLYHLLKRNSYLLISREKDSWPGLDVKLRGILKCLLCFLTKTFSVILSFRYLRQYWFYKYLLKLTLKLENLVSSAWSGKYNIKSWMLVCVECPRWVSNIFQIYNNMDCVGFDVKISI